MSDPQQLQTEDELKQPIIDNAQGQGEEEVEDAKLDTPVKKTKIRKPKRKYEPRVFKVGEDGTEFYIGQFGGIYKIKITKTGRQKKIYLKEENQAANLQVTVGEDESVSVDLKRKADGEPEPEPEPEAELQSEEKGTVEPPPKPLSSRAAKRQKREKEAEEK